MQRRQEQFEMPNLPQGFGVRWQSAAATPLFERRQACESGVALRSPPQSKTLRVLQSAREIVASSRLCVFALKMN